MTFVCVRDFMLNYYAPTNTFKRVQLHRHAMRKFTEAKIKSLGAKWGGTIVLLPTLAALWEPFMLPTNDERVTTVATTTTTLLLLS